MTVRVALVLRAGGKHNYGPEHVTRLCALLDQHLPNWPRIILSDVPVPGEMTAPLRHNWPGWWSKMELMRPDISGDLFYLDLDTTPVGDLSAMASIGTLTALSDRRSGINSSAMYLPEAYRQKLWALWLLGGPDNMMKQYRGDQDFLYAQFPRRWRTFDASLPGCAASFKRQIQPGRGVPQGTALVYYHGHPKPWQLEGALPWRT